MFLAKETPPPFSKCTQRVAKYLCADCCRWLGSASIFGKEAIALVATYWRSAQNRATRGSIAKSIRVRTDGPVGTADGPCAEPDAGNVHIGDAEALYRKWRASFWICGEYGHSEFSQIASRKAVVIVSRPSRLRYSKAGLGNGTAFSVLAPLGRSQMTPAFTESEHCSVALH